MLNPESHKLSGEEVYKQDVAPELIRLAKICQDAGISMVVAAEFGPGDKRLGVSSTIAIGSSLQIRLIKAICVLGGNLDALIAGFKKYGNRDQGQRLEPAEQTWVNKS